MIGFIGTSLQLESFIRVHTLNASWITNYDSCLTNAPSNEFCWAFSRVPPPLYNFGEPNRGHHLEELAVILSGVMGICFSDLLHCNGVFVVIHCSGNVITGPLFNNGHPLGLHYSGFHSVLTEPLHSNALFSHNIGFMINMIREGRKPYDSGPS
jgi:hypothetical protein